MQILDHCAIYLLIAGTYTPIIVCRFMETYWWTGMIVLILQWGLAALAITLNAIDLSKFKLFSMICYIFLGWGIIFFLPQLLTVIEIAGFWYLLAGGISYTVGAILFGLGVKIRWMHSVFHIFVVIGSLLQFISIYFYIL
jgi:hemolysin III